MTQSKTPPSATEVAKMLARLRGPYYWMSGSEEYHEGENDAPFEAADMLEVLAARVAELDASAKNALAWETANPAAHPENVKAVFRDALRTLTQENRHDRP